jgi:prevent-host-death family protein
MEIIESFVKCTYIFNLFLHIYGMKILTIAEFRGNIKKYLDIVTDNREPILINRSGSKGAVIIPIEEYNSINLKTSMSEQLERDIKDYFAIKNIDFLITPVNIYSTGTIPQMISFTCANIDGQSFSVEFVFKLSEKRITLRDKKGELLKYNLDVLVKELSEIIMKRIEVYNKSLIS